MAWYKSRKGWIFAVLATIAFGLDTWGRAESASSIYNFTQAHWHSIAPWIAPTLFVIALVFFERQRRTPYDLDTLPGRTLALCDELRKFKTELGKEPQLKYSSSMSAAEFTKVNLALGLRESKMHHAFAFRFAERVLRIYHEFGAMGKEDAALTSLLQGKIQKDEDLGKIIERLSDLAKSGD